jgi:hypothetical protein
MMETLTNNLNSPVIDNEMMEVDVMQNVGADEILFYNDIRADLDEIQLMPKTDTVNRILNYSKNYAG